MSKLGDELVFAFLGVPHLIQFERHRALARSNRETPLGMDSILFRASNKLPSMKSPRKLSPEESAALLGTLQKRFEKNQPRHEGIAWATVRARLEAHPDRLWSLQEMEKTGGEPDVVGQDKETGAYIFMDCSPETPTGRRSVCYDREGLESRKEHKPANTAIDMAREMGIEMLTEDEYRALQRLGTFDVKTSSWVKTPPDIRKQGGALFCDSRYGHVFLYHNGAQSYYGARAFRGVLRV